MGSTRLRKSIALRRKLNIHRALNTSKSHVFFFPQYFYNILCVLLIIFMLIYSFVLKLTYYNELGEEKLGGHGCFPLHLLSEA